MVQEGTREDIEGMAGKGKEGERGKE